ncbi:WXG100 family type VII secretion target [Peterkaempfera griseoplana]|uniref:WXG100 family type VII secretion target n=1 Tax=Peterkaempfera griseoplana TaxID=66896 RepID=UPI0006E1DA78|nr:WXG100 family type VII secretion target [Peterkaempfera griseoplana]
MSDLVNVPAGTTSAGITNFEHWDLIPIKNMVQHSKPGRLKDVAAHWMQVKTELEGAAQELQAATEHITAHWEGSAAQGFVERSSVLQQSIVNTGAHAENTSHALTYASTALDAAKTEMQSIHVPGTMEKAKDKVSDLGHRDDTQFRADVAAGMDRDAAVAKNAGSLSVTEERHQQAIAVMERLAPQYKAASTVLAQPVDPVSNPKRPLPPPAKKITEPRQVGPTPTNPRQTTGTTNPSTRQVGTNPTYRDPGSPDITGQPHDSGGTTTDPTHGGTIPVGTVCPPYHDPIVPGGPTHTGIDSTGGGTTLPTEQLPGGFGPGGGGGSGGGSGSGYGGGGYVPGGGYVGGGSGTSSTGGRTGSGSYGSGAGTGQGRAGAGGMSGMGGMGGAGRGGLGSRGASSGLARRAGGSVGGAGKRAGGSFTEGGSGLGRNRGSGAGNGRGGGVMPGGAAGQKKKDKKGGSRPDYLVEDEDTWTNGGGPANPPVIE